MKKIDYVVRVLSVAPLLAAIMLVVLYVSKPGLFASLWSFGSMVLTLGVMPLLAYPLQRFIPGFKGKGRDGQRTLAMIFAVAGYILCAVMLLILGGTHSEYLICLTYLISGLLIFIVNKVFKIHASGHGCGVCGPIPVLLLLGSYIAAAVYSVSAIFVCISSIRSKRHTLTEFLGGAAISVITAVVLALLLIW